MFCWKKRVKKRPGDAKTCQVCHGFPSIDWRRTTGQPLSCQHQMTTNPQPRIYVTFTTGVKAWIVNKSDVDAVDSHV